MSHVVRRSCDYHVGCTFCVTRLQETLQYVSSRALSELKMSSIEEAKDHFAKKWTGVTAMRQEWQVRNGAACL